VSGAHCLSGILLPSRPLGPIHWVFRDDEPLMQADEANRIDGSGSIAELWLQVQDEAVSRVLILLSTYNGAAYLHEQLQSLSAQIHTNWIVYWRDDGSSDGTVAIMSEFAAAVGDHRVVRVAEPMGRLWPTASFIALLRAALPAIRVADCVAFADQDDVWLPDKLARGVKALAGANVKAATLYCARLAVVDANLQLSRSTTITQRGCGFPAALTENIATGCTVMLNSSAAKLIAKSVLPCGTYHDWWSYILVTAAGGRVLVDETVVALYRQHGSNVVGVPGSQTRRAVTALWRGPAAFMNMLRRHVQALVSQPDLVTEHNYLVSMRIHDALQGRVLQKVAALCLPGLRRQGRLETLLFRIWFLIG
jgi:glycosyltransferase involved in cell wall biosynthesis